MSLPTATLVARIAPGHWIACHYPQTPGLNTVHRREKWTPFLRPVGKIVAGS
jgi:hypothetical protein